MGLILNKGTDGEYRRTWYAIISENGRHTSRKLATPLRGKIPLDPAGRYSLSLVGDPAFEASKAEARKELQDIIDTAKRTKAEERNAPGYTERQVYRKLKGEKFEKIKLADLSAKNRARARYAIDDEDAGGDTDAKRRNKYNKSVRDILDHFAAWCAANARRTTRRKCVYITDIGRDVVSEYYKEISGAYSWQTFRKYVFILASVYRYFMPTETENPFSKVYEDGYKGRKSTLDKSSIVHEAPSESDLRRIWDYAATIEDKPYLRRIAIAAACTGMRIGDVCLLTWDKVDLLNGLILTKTAKTKKKIGVPIFDYDPGADDYHETLGELRRELEAALVERKEGEVYVFPQAASIYQRDPTRINKLGKALFARALFSKPEPEDAILVGEEPPKKTEAEVVALIEAARIDERKKARLVRTYELRARGKTYSQIAAAIGNGKGNVSEDLRDIEDITGERLRTGNPYLGANAKPGLHTLLKKTRAERAAGQRAACLFGWHSFRVAFVVMAIRSGIKPDDLRLVVGHSTVRMVLHYYNPEEAATAIAIRRQISKGRKRANAAAPQIAAPVPSLPAPTAPTTTTTEDEATKSGAAILANAIQAILATPGLTPEAKNAAIAAISASATTSGGGMV